jgi:methyltransferase (TIGR00027 family)
MTTTVPGISHISDTARWVAVYRAMETERPDAIFRDPFARGLAGERGEAAVASIPRARSMAWAMIVRTAVFDELILSTIGGKGVDTVLNLAAGLDARPWRLELPPTLRWIDVDLPDILNYKTESLRNATPRCRYEAIAADLTDEAERRRVMARVAEGSTNALVVTEGLLVYLTEEQVTALARDLASVAAIKWWLIDLASPRLLQWMTRAWGKNVAKGNAPFRFAPEAGTEFFRPAGWEESVYRSAMHEAHRLKREMKGMWFWRFLLRFYPAKRREEMKRFSGVVLLERI